MKRLIIGVGVILLIVLGLIGLVLLLTKNWISGGICTGIPLIFFVLFGLGGLKTVHQEEVFMIELLGSFYKIKKPGLIWVCPVIMKKRAMVEMWEQSVDLFKENPKIDFTGGGSAKLVKPKVWFKIENPYKVIYGVDDWVIALRSKIENLFRDFLSNNRVEAIIDQEAVHPWWTLIKESSQSHNQNPEAEILGDWGMKVTSITVEDFDWSDEVVKTRKEVFVAGREEEREKNLAKAALFKSKKKAVEIMGLVIQMLSQATGKSQKYIQSEIQGDTKLKTKVWSFVQEVITLELGLEKGAVQDIRVGGSTGMEKSFLTLISAFKGGKTDVKEEKEEKEEKEKEEKEKKEKED